MAQQAAQGLGWCNQTRFLTASETEILSQNQALCVCETAMVTRELLMERELLSLVRIAGEISTPLPCALRGKSHLPLPIVTDGLSCTGWWLFAKTSVNSTGAITENCRSFYPSFPRDLLLSSPFFELVKRVSQPLLVKRGGGGGPSGPLV